MKFKVDENLPIEAATLLQGGGPDSPLPSAVVAHLWRWPRKMKSALLIAANLALLTLGCATYRTGRFVVVETAKRKVRIALRLRRETTMTLKWMAEQLAMGTWASAARQLYEAKTLKSVGPTRMALS
jgi:hypothetical protein